MYKLFLTPDKQKTSGVIRFLDGAAIPADPDNRDYQTFKKDLAEGASLKDAEGNDMTVEQITTFLGTLA
jgi:hypothetical protein